MSRPKEKYAKFRKTDTEKIELSPHPFENEVLGTAFITLCGATTFRGQITPANFEYSVDENDVLEEGQPIGISRNGQVLYWENEQVIARDGSQRNY